MRLIIESTGIITRIDGVPVRLWEGRTESGRRAEVFVHRVATSDARVQAELEAATSEVAAPARSGPVEQTLSVEDLEQLVREQVEANRGRVRPSPAQAAIDAAALAALEEGEIHLASGLLLLSSHRIAETHPLANQVLMQAAIDAGIRFGPRHLRN